MMQFYKSVATTDIINKKFFFALMAFTGILNSYAMRSCITVALTSMTILQVIEEDDEDSNACVYEDYRIERSDNVGDSKRYNWSQETQGIIIGSYYIGYAVSNVPGAILADRYGGKIVQATGFFILTTFTILTPILVKFGEANALVGARILEGLGDGVTFPSISIMIADWIPPHQISTLGSMIFSGMLLGSSFGQAIAGFIIGLTNDWTIAFYLFGIISYTWLTLWVLFIFNTPSTHPFISTVEKEWLEEKMGDYERGDDIPEVPWGSIFGSVSVWSLLIAQAGVSILLSVAGLCLPKYLSDILRFSVSEVGFYSAMPYLAMWVGALIFAHIVNTYIIAGMITVTTARKWCNTTGTFLPAIFIIMASYFRCNRRCVVLSFTAALGTMGAYFPGILVNPIDLSPNYAGYIMALMNVVSAGISAGTPYVIGLLVPNASILEWRFVFWITFFIAITTGCVYLIFGSAEVKQWNFGKITESQEFLPKLHYDNNGVHLEADNKYKDSVKFDSNVKIIASSNRERVSIVSSISSEYADYSMVEIQNKEDSGHEIVATPAKRAIRVSDNFSDIEVVDTTQSSSKESAIEEEEKQKKKKEADKKKNEEKQHKKS